MGGRRGRRSKTEHIEQLVLSDFEENDTTCEVCYAEFLDYQDLVTHRQQVHQMDPIGTDCSFCDAHLSDIESYATHIVKKHLHSLHFCQYCQRSYIDVNKLRVHAQLHLSNKEGTVSCSNCPSFMKNCHELRLHEFNNHKDVKDGVMLHDCYPYLTSKLNMRASEFIRLYRTNISLTCICSYMGNTQDYLKHLKVSNCASYVCNDCMMPFKRLSVLRRHSCSSQNTNDEICKVDEPVKHCNTCSKDISIIDYKGHKKRCSNNVCVVCQKKFQNLDALLRHQSEHTYSIKQKTCIYCRLEIFNVKLYKRHVEKCHKDFKTYKYTCVYCTRPLLFNHPQKLLAHFYSQHPDVKPYRCNICSLDFRIKKKFSMHIVREHQNIGFVEYTEQYNVHFNKEKMENGLKLTARKEMFTEEDLADFKAANLQDEPTKPVTKKKRLPSLSSDDEPLIKKRNVKNITLLNKLAKNKTKNKRLVCKICALHCRTVQNYNRHVAMHFSNNSVINCVKCDKTFNNRKDLENHMEEEHETAHITSKLKSILEKKKLSKKICITDSPSQRFRNTIKKVDYNPAAVQVQIKQVEQASVKNYLESFASEEKKIEIDASVTIKPVVDQTKPFTIKMVKCDLTPLPLLKPKLKMPTKVDLSNDLLDAKVKIKPSTARTIDKPKLNFGVREDNANFDVIPEMGEEVVYEMEEMPQMKEISIPDVPKEFGPIKVATLQTTAPYYKIVDLKELSEKPNVEKEIFKDVEEIQLPHGRLVRSNPLAHLMKDTKMQLPILRKNYEPKLKNPQKVLAAALMKMAQQNSNPPKRKKPVKKKT